MNQGRLMNKGNYSFSTQGVWLYIYLTCIVILSYILPHTSPIAFIILTVMGIPFVTRIESFLAVTMVLSPIAYFFSCADEAIMSLHTLGVIFIIFQIIKCPRLFMRKDILLRILLIGVAFVSFKSSPFDTFYGFVELAYIVVVSMFVTICPRIDKDVLLEQLLKAACCMLFLVGIILVFNPYVSGSGKMSVSQSVNANTTSFELVYLIVVIASFYFFVKRQKKLLYFSVAGFVLFLVSGSRNSLLSIILTSAIVYLIDAKRQKKIGTRIIGLILISCISIVLFDIVLGDSLGAKFDITYVIQTGGTNRMAIWAYIIPYVIDNHFLFGYGPSKGATSSIIRGFMGRTYSHSHNTLVEVFSETGVVGFVIFVWIIWSCFRNLLLESKKDKSVYVFLSVFLCVLFSGIGESYFNDIVLWLIIGVSLRTDLSKKGVLYECQK